MSKADDAVRALGYGGGVPRETEIPDSKGRKRLSHLDAVAEFLREKRNEIARAMRLVQEERRGLIGNVNTHKARTA